MTTATRSVAVVATRLPNTDRRALSQAWYSALHLNESQPGSAAKSVAKTPVRAASSHVSSPAAARPNLSTPASPRTFASAQRPASAPAYAERRGPVTDLSRRLERALVRHAAHTHQPTATLAINAGDGRVRLLVRTQGVTTRVVALCAPHLRERVDRALAHARFALAATGTRIEAA